METDTETCAYQYILEHICVHQVHKHIYQTYIRINIVCIWVYVYICSYLICVYLFISVHMRKYLLVSVCIESIYVHICAYLCVSGLYLCIFAYICVYLCISVYILKPHFQKKKT